jgi:hypothetical protein
MVEFCTNTIQMNAQEILEYCNSRTTRFINRAEELKLLPLEKLTRKDSPESWSVLECLEHLNLYADFYNPAIRSAIENSKSVPTESFKSGWLGGYFAKSMLPKEKFNKMKTFKDKNPIYASLDSAVIDRFIAQQNEFLTLLNQAEKVNLNTAKTPVTISKLIRLKLGDTFQFLVNHNIRHFEQLESAVK